MTVSCWKFPLTRASTDFAFNFLNEKENCDSDTESLLAKCKVKTNPIIVNKLLPPTVAQSRNYTLARFMRFNFSTTSQVNGKAKKDLNERRRWRCCWCIRLSSFSLLVVPKMLMFCNMFGISINADFRLPRITLFRWWHGRGFDGTQKLLLIRKAIKLFKWLSARISIFFFHVSFHLVYFIPIIPVEHATHWFILLVDFF